MPMGHEHVCIFERFSGYFFLKFSQNKIVIGKKDLCAVFGCNNDRLFSEKITVKECISNTKLEKGDHYYIQTRHKDLFFRLQSYSKKTLRKNVPKSARKYKRNVLMPPGHPIILLKSN